MSVEEAAAELGILPRAVRHRLQVGRMKGEKVGARTWVIAREEVERWRGRRIRPGPRKDDDG